MWERRYTAEYHGAQLSSARLNHPLSALLACSDLFIIGTFCLRIAKEKFTLQKLFRPYQRQFDG